MSLQILTSKTERQQQIKYNHFWILFVCLLYYLPDTVVKTT